MQVAASATGTTKKATTTKVAANTSLAHVVIDQVIASCILLFVSGSNALHSTGTHLVRPCSPDRAGPSLSATTGQGRTAR